MKKNDKNVTQGARRNLWISGVFALLCLFGTSGLNAQINYSQDFASCNNASCNGWTMTAGFSPNITAATGSGYSPCIGASAKGNVFGATNGILVATTSLGVSNGMAADVSFIYKTIDWSTGTATAAGSGTYFVEWSTAAAGPWTTITSFPNAASATCITAGPFSFTPPIGVNVFIRLRNVYGFGDYWVVFDDISVVQAAAIACSGAPAPGNTTGPSNICGGASFSLGLQNFTIGTGVDYTWYRSTLSSTGPWTPFGGSTPTVSTSILGQTWFYCEVECTEAGGDIGDSNVLEVNLDATPAFPETFTSVANPNCWSLSGSINPVWSTVGGYAASGGSVRYNFYNISAGGSPTLNSPVFAAAPSGAEVSFDAAGATYTGGEIDQIILEESNDGGATWSTVAVMTNASPGGVLNTGGAISGSFTPASGQWTTLTYPLTTGTNRIRFRGNSDFGNNVHLDNINVIVAVACDVAPSPGNTESTTALACNGVDFTLSLENETTGSGVSYQWFESTDSDAGPWTPVGTDAPTYTTSQSVQTWYYAEVTCATGPDTGASNVIEINMESHTNCYCIPTWAAGGANGCQDGDVIARVAVNTLDNESGALCLSGALGYNDYTDYSMNPEWTTDLQAGTSYNVQVYAGQYSQHLAVWIDFNDDGIFDNPGERVGFTTTAAPGSGLVGVTSATPAVFTISLACNPPVGEHRMRVRSLYQFTLANGGLITPCAQHGQWGETEDYIVNVLAPPACPEPSGLVSSNVTAGSVDLDWNTGCTETAWEVEYGATGFTPGTGTTVPAGTNIAFTLGGLDDETAYDVYVRADCDIDGLSSNFGPISITTLALPPANDLCANAIAIVCGQVVTGSTVLSSSTGNPGTCGTGLGTSGGVWYTLQGINGVMTAQLCGSSFDTKIGVFTGSCGSFTCVIGEDDDFTNCGTNDPFVSWTGSSAQTYYIYVTGFFTETGAFTLTTDCVTDYASFEYQTSNVTSVESCQEVTVQVNLVTFGPITNADLQLSYNTAELELVSAVAAHPIGPLYPVGNVITSTPGIIQYAVNTFGGYTPIGTATIPYLTLTFRGVETSTPVAALVTPVLTGIGETQIVNFFGFDEFGLPMTQNVMSGAETLTVNVSPDTTVPDISGTIAATTIEACLATEVPAAVTSVAALEALGLTISDICTADEDLVVTSEDVPAGTCPIVVTRTYTVTDASGNFSTTVQVINVDDTTAPIITCAAVPGTLFFNSGVLYSVVGAEFDPGVSDNCGTFTVSHNAVASGGIVAGADNISLAGWGFPLGGPYTITFTAEDACGNVSDCSITFSVTPQEVNVTAIINMACNDGAAVRIQVFPVGAVLNGDVVATFDAALDGSGQFTQSLTGVPSGNYDVVIKVERYLAKKVSNVDFTSSTTSPNVSIISVIPGDIAGPGFADNIVGATDLSLLIFHYNTLLAGPNYNDRCDLNCDNKIDALDLSFLSFFYNTVGATPWNN
jgi:hypothetical protein